MKRQRQPNFTSHERETLITLVEKYKGVIENKQTDGVTTQEKNKAWNTIAKQFNALSPNHLCRSEEALKFFYKNLKKELRKKAAEHKKETYLTGGGPEPPQFSDDCNKLLSIINDKTVFGLSSQYDNDVLELGQCSAAREHDSVDNIEEILPSVESELDLIEDEESEKTNWKRHKASDLKRRPDMALISKTDSTVPININNIEVILEEDLPKTNLSLTANTTKTGEASITPKKVHCLSSRRPNTVKTLTSSKLGEKYEILVHKKRELAELLKKEHEARMIALELDIKLKQKQLEQLEKNA